MLKEAPEASNKYSIQLTQAPAFPWSAPCFTDGSLTRAPYEKTALFIISRNSSSATKLCIFLFRKFTPGPSGQWFTLSLFSIFLGLTGGRKGVEVSGGGKSWRVEDWWVPGDGETGAWRTGEWAVMGASDSPTFVGDDEAWVGLRLACFCPAGCILGCPIIPQLHLWPESWGTDTVSQFGVTEAAVSPIKRRPWVRIVVAPQGLCVSKILWVSIQPIWKLTWFTLWKFHPWCHIHTWTHYVLNEFTLYVLIRDGWEDVMLMNDHTIH